MKLTKLLGIPLILCFTPTAHALSFNLTNTTGMSAQYLAGFQTAANLWSSKFSDAVTVNIDIGIQALGSGILGQAGSAWNSYSYGIVKTKLTQDATSSVDLTAVAHLQNGSYFDFVLNRTTENPNGSGSATPYIDMNDSANNYWLSMTTANAKALNLLGATTSADAAITFSSNFNWDFNAADGIAANTYDFVGVAAHEIGHALGFVSFVDDLDYFSQAAQGGPYSGDDFALSGFGAATLDLFRYSDISCSNGGIQDLSADTRSKYFSIDGCTTNLGAFSTGTFYGDGNQASHWKDDLGLGILDPTAASGEILSITALDLKALDVIGWNRIAEVVAVPTPSIGWLIGSGLMAFFASTSTRRKYNFA